MPVIKPMGERIMVIPLEPESSLEKRGEAAGIKVILEEKSKARSTRGRVVAVGPGPLVSEYIKVGCDVLYSPYAGIETQVNGVTYLSLEYREITHVIEPEVPQDPKVGAESSSDQSASQRSPGEPQSPSGQSG